ncbi:MAG TPA: hypothetical protein VK169_02410 [Saprospiraceae bacterium]|nr:hypothetical protein [Saprospiraceae bacterium]
MAENFADHLIQIETVHKELLGQIRHWGNLKIATEGNYIWIKNFTELQLASTELHSIPFTKTFVCKDNLLFPKESLLPFKKMPNLLWTPIERALNIELPNFNHNFFGIHQPVEIKLISTDAEQKATVLLVNMQTASKYISNASAIRLKPLEWVLIDAENALIFGEPMLPIDGKTFWQKGKFIFPVGLHLEFQLLEKAIEKKLNLSQNQLIWWTSEYNYCLIDSKMLKPLSISSWKQTLKID